MLESGNDSRNGPYLCVHVYFFQAPTIFTNITSVCVQPYDFVSIWIEATEAMVSDPWF